MTDFVDEDWEEWDGQSPFWHHCVAGSMAGLAEHTLVYPLDTVRTHIQVCANCKFSPSYNQAAAMAAKSSHSRTSGASTSRAAAHKPLGGMASHRLAAQQQQLPQGMLQTMRYLMSEPAVLANPEIIAAKQEPPKAEGIFRLWRGVQTMMIGCIPAHALYFSSYEMTKAFFKGDNAELVWYGGMMAGATATLGHDLIMAPLDTVKQRLQIGHYQGSMVYGVQQMIKKEGAVALYRSFPITLFANVPYGMIMVGTNESLKELWTRSEDGHKSLSLGTTLLASSAAGFVASAATTPLDRIKTLLQTQQMAPACWPTPPAHCPQKVAVAEAPVVHTAYQALRLILQQEGAVGLFRGIVPRVISHTPAVAISWTTYETAKSALWKVTNH